MIVTAFVQARMTSTRLPGKVLADVIGSPMILRQLNRLKHSQRITNIVVVTSIDKSDDELVEVLESNGIKVFRGSLTNVLNRYQEAISQHYCDVAVRITADCPLIDPELCDAIIESHVASNADYTSNTINRRYPRGLDCEVFQPEILTRLNSYNLTSEEREHVTLGIYTRPREFSINSFENVNDESARRWTVDTKKDLDFIRYVYKNLATTSKDFSSDDIRSFLLSNPTHENLETFFTA